MGRGWWALVAATLGLALFTSGCGGRGDAASATQAAVLLSREQHREVASNDPRIHELAQIIDRLQERCEKVDEGVDAAWVGSLITDARTRPRLEQTVPGYLAAARLLDAAIADEPPTSCFLLLSRIGGA